MGEKNFLDNRYKDVLSFIYLEVDSYLEVFV